MKSKTYNWHIYNPLKNINWIPIKQENLEIFQEALYITLPKLQKSVHHAQVALFMLQSTQKRQRNKSFNNA